MPIQRDKVILVNERDEWTGTAEKMEAHREGWLHRAVSIFITNAAGEMLLQRRALEKYHSGGLWSNACCSHPSPGESTLAAAHRRMGEELGFGTSLHAVTKLAYKADVGAGLLENEYDHIYHGEYDGNVIPAAEEVMDYRYVPLTEIDAWMERDPQAFSAWFPILYNAWKTRRVGISA